MENSDIIRSLLCGVSCVGGVFLVVVGIIALFVVNNKRSKERFSVPNNWLAVAGRVTASRVEKAARSHDEDDELFMPYIEFQYSVEGQVYTGQQAVGRPSNMISKSNRTLASYPVGGGITVYYNPEQIDQARLKI